MTVTSLLESMCSRVLSDADMKAIAKSRGFSPREASSRASFENAFLSEIGLDAAFASLTVDEIACLHLLSLKTEPVDIRYFTRLYRQERNEWRARSWTQRYGPVFKGVQQSLVRKGVLLISEAYDSLGKRAKMERWRFLFPREFAARLPVPFANTESLEKAGVWSQDLLRHKLMEVFKPQAGSADRKYLLRLCSDRLCIDERPFKLANLLAWQRYEWNRSVWAASKNKVRAPAPAGDTASARVDDFTPIVAHTFSRLAPGEWVRDEALGTILRLFYHPAIPPDAREVCEQGWRLGGLTRLTIGGHHHYRLTELRSVDSERKPEDYLQVSNDTTLVMDMRLVPYRSLELLAGISRLRIDGSRLEAVPDFIGLGRAPASVWSDPLTQWIQARSGAFQETMARVEAQRGKQIIHDNLLLAKVKDLSLKVQIQKAFPDPARLVVLPNDYLAFPRGSLADIQQLVTRSGYVIRTTKAS